MPAKGTIVTCPSCATRNRLQPTPAGFPRCSVCQTVLPWVVEAGPDTFDREITSSLPVLVDLWAPWCGPCRMVSPLVERLGRENAGRLKVVKLNVDEAPAIAARYEVRGIPLLLLISDGTVVDRLTGAAPLERLQAWLAPHLAPVPEASSASGSA
ncbi:MAG: thioredoxin [Solirubrobacteraceae bacterium]